MYTLVYTSLSFMYTLMYTLLILSTFTVLMYVPEITVTVNNRVL